MIKINEYFHGTVKSLGVENTAGKATVGVMDVGEYEFGTAAPEKMTLITGTWEIKLPGETSFQSYAKSITVHVPGNSKFQLKVTEQSAYLCEFV